MLGDMLLRAMNERKIVIFRCIGSIISGCILNVDD
jgi:hypothetical protein